MLKKLEVFGCNALVELGDPVLKSYTTYSLLALHGFYFDKEPLELAYRTTNKEPHDALITELGKKPYLLDRTQ